MLRVANKYIHKEDLKVLVVGNASEFEKQLAALGPVTPIDITIPAPQAKTEAARPAASSIGSGTRGGGESNPEGKAAVAKLIEAMGGAESECGEDSAAVVHDEAAGRGREIVQSTAYPDKQAQQISMPQVEVLQVVTPESAFLVMRKRATDFSPSQRASVVAASKRDFLNVLQHVNDASYMFRVSGKERLG